MKKTSDIIGKICDVWMHELRTILKDQGVMLFMVIVPLAYPLLYSWIYNNEVVREVPVAAVDLAQTSQSRDFLRRCDASPDVSVCYQVTDMGEAQRLLAEQKIWGIYVIPSDFSLCLNRMEQTQVKVYCDMSVMLYYKAVFQTASNVASAMNERLQVELAHPATSRDAELTTHPLTFSEITLFNPSGGYGSFILPPVLLLILQQTLLLGMGMAAATRREHRQEPSGHPAVVLAGRSLCYLPILLLTLTYLTVIVPRLFGFPALAGAKELLGVLLPFLLACLFFSIAVSVVVKRREDIILMVVFASVPLLFLSGVSWPQSAIPTGWSVFSWLFPSTFGIRAFVRTNTMGAQLADVTIELQGLWIQVAVYGVLALWSVRKAQCRQQELSV